jgi:hypothetical protein
MNAHVPVGISAAASTKQKPYIGYKANVLCTQARINAIL